MTTAATATRPGTVRPAAVAGTFYPAEAEALARMVDDCLAGARDWGLAPKALIAPHAGFVFSGPIAGSAFRQIAAMRGRITRVVLVGPPHRVPVRKFAVRAAHRLRRSARRYRRVARRRCAPSRET